MHTLPPQEQKLNAIQTRDKYEQECLKIKGYLAQGHMVMGQEERRNKAKLEKTQIAVAASNTEYETAVKALEDTTTRWNREWKAASDKFQDLEEERLDFTKSSLWTFANIASTVCVSDDSSCEKIRLSLETMDVEQDIVTFITEKGTGQEIPDAPKYVNFCRGDVNDSQSEVSEDDNYSVAQFPRNINPAFRSSSPQPSTFESHHDPNSALAQDLAHRDLALPSRREPSSVAQNAMLQPSDELIMQPQKSQQRHQLMSQQVAPQIDRHMHQQMQHMQKMQQTRPLEMRPLETRQPDMRPAEMRSPMETQPSLDTKSSMEVRRQPEEQYRHQPPAGHIGYDVNQHGPVSAVPHDPYPMDGMTMLCRTDPLGPPSDRSSQVTSARPSSRDSHSEYSNPTSFSSMEPPSGKTSPVKQDPSPVPSPVKLVAKKKSGGFLKNHSPFRRKSNKELQPTNRNTWHAPSSQASASPTRRPQQYNQGPPIVAAERTQSPEPIDANASLALGVGQNVFSVSNTDSKRQQKQDPAQEQEEMDPIALALAELKGVTLGKQSSVRMSADHYHGISTPQPGSEASSASRSVPIRGNKDVAAAKRGTPPPSYQTPTSRLGVPPPAVTSKAMKEATKKVTNQTRSVFGDHTRAGSVPQNIPGSMSRPGTRTPNVGRGESGSYSGSPSSRPATRNTNVGRSEPGSYSSASVSRPPTRGSEMGRVDTGGYNTPPVARSGTRATEASRMDSGGYNAPPLSRPGTRGADMSRGGSGVFGTSPGSRPGTRGSDMRAASPAPTRSVSPQPPMNDSSRMSYRSVSPNPYAASQRSPSVMSTPRNRGSDAGYYQQSSPQPVSRGPSPSLYKEYNRPQSSYGGSGMAVQLAPLGDPYGSQRSRGSRPSSRAAGYQESDSVADPSRLYTRDGRPIMHYGKSCILLSAQ